MSATEPSRDAAEKAVTEDLLDKARCCREAQESTRAAMRALALAAGVQRRSSASVLARVLAASAACVCRTRSGVAVC